jgi:hypothetical protein
LTAFVENHIFVKALFLPRSLRIVMEVVIKVVYIIGLKPVKCSSVAEERKLLLASERAALIEHR